MVSSEGYGEGWGAGVRDGGWQIRWSYDLAGIYMYL